MYAIDLIRQGDLFGPWSLNPSTASELDYQLYLLQPKVAVECGSGISTLALARYAKETGNKAISLEHDPIYFDRTKKLLGDDLAHVDLRLSPLHYYPPEYDTKITETIDFLLIDGPPEGKGGRAAILPWLYPNLSEIATIWLDDGNRPGEQEAMARWMTRYPMWKQTTELPKGLTVLTRTKPKKEQFDFSNTFCTVLTGGRPDLLDDTLSHLPNDVKENMTALANGNDTATVDIISKHQINHISTDTMLPIGEATSLLAKLTQESGKKYWLAFQDDWRFITLDPDWFTRAKQALRRCDIVRLRHYSDKTLDHHMVSKADISYKALTKIKAGVKGNMHWTFNPMLMKTKDIEYVFPAKNERDAQVKAHKAGKNMTCQLYPGCCVHTGWENSMKAKRGKLA